MRAKARRYNETLAAQATRRKRGGGGGKEGGGKESSPFLLLVILGERSDTHFYGRRFGPSFDGGERRGGGKKEGGKCALGTRRLFSSAWPATWLRGMTREHAFRGLDPRKVRGGGGGEGGKKRPRLKLSPSTLMRRFEKERPFVIRELKGGGGKEGEKKGGGGSRLTSFADFLSEMRGGTYETSVARSRGAEGKRGEKEKGRLPR